MSYNTRNSEICLYHKWHHTLNLCPLNTDANTHISKRQLLFNKRHAEWQKYRRFNTAVICDTFLRLIVNPTKLETILRLNLNSVLIATTITMWH